MKAEAAVLIEQNKPLQITEITIPEPVAGQVLVRVKASGICGAQLREITGAAGYDKYLPHLLGHEGGGIVLKTGPGVHKVKKGDHVVLHWRKGTGAEAAPAKYNDGIGGGPVTTFNEACLVSENRVTKIEKDIPFSVAALMGCAITTGFGLVYNEAKLKAGQSIAVCGVGGVGLNVIQAADIAGAGRIVAIDIDHQKLVTAEYFGANSFVINDDPILFKQEVGKIDVFVDCTGAASVINLGLQAVKPGGKMILVGQPKNGETVSFDNFSQHYCGKTIIDSQGGLTNPDTDIPRYLDLYRSQKLNVKGLITRATKLKDVNTTIDLLRKGRITGRAIINM